MFVPLSEPPPTSEGEPLVVAVHGNKVALLEEGADTTDGVFLGLLAGRHCWAIDGEVGEPRHDLPYRNLHQLWGAVDDRTWMIAGRAVQLIEWARTHRFCGRCGDTTELVPGERSRRCRTCRLAAFPRLAPAMITLVERDDGKALLARGPAFPRGMFSCLAGFVEPGETLEEAVHREVHEEVGLTLKGLRYFGSQPWPFPHSLMIGFFAEYGEGELRLDEQEIVEAGWFAPDELPMIPGDISIARRLIDDWLARSATT
jgi:NAD+ diphosphatase